MAASVFPSTGWATLRRGVVPGFAASDIMQGAPVCIASSGDQAYQMCQSSHDKPVGVARDYAIAGNAVAVYDDGNEVRMLAGAGASFSRQSYVGVVGTSAATHPQSGVSVTFPVLGAVAGGSPLGVGGVGSQTWAVGVAYESAAAGDQALYKIEPRLLSGLVSA